MKNKQQHLYSLEEDLEPWLPREGEIGNFLSAAAKASETLDKEIESVKIGLILQKSTSKAEIEQISKPLGLVSNDSESVDEFRKRVLAKFQTISSSGNPEDIISISSLLLNVDKNNITLENMNAEPKFRLKAPAKSIKSEFGTTEDVVSMLLDATSTTYGLNVIGTGTLDYITPTERTDGTYDSTKGYATLDADGNITSGGTYSGYYESR